MTYNSARVYVGGYVGGGTNEFEQWIVCSYEVTDGSIITKRLRPIRVRGTNSEGTIFRLETLVLYPKSETATVRITKGQRKLVVHLIKRQGFRSRIFKLRL